MRFRQPVHLFLSLLLLSSFLAACALPVRLDPQVIKAVTLDNFVEQLSTALLQHDYDQLQRLMGNSFVMAGWRAEGQVMPPAVAIVQLRNQYLGAGSAAAIPARVDWGDLLGATDPLTLWGADVPAVKALYVTGLSGDQQDEAVLIIAQPADGTPYWHSMLVAADGFRDKAGSVGDTAGALAKTETTTATTLLAATTNDAPAPTVAVDALPRLVFNPDATSAAMRGILSAQNEQHYLVRALEGQQLVVKLASLTGQATFLIRGVGDGQSLVEGRQGLTQWQGTVPATQDYQITIAAPTTTPFELVTHFDPRQAAVAPAPAPLRLVFAAGASIMTVTGRIAAPEHQRYLVRGVAGQKLQVALTGATKTTTFAVQGITDGKPLKRLDTVVKSWSSTLPMTQDYLITVTTSGAAVDYTLELEME